MSETTDPMNIEQRLDKLVRAVCLMHDALAWSDRRYSGAYGDKVRELLQPIADDLKARRTEPPYVE